MLEAVPQIGATEKAKRILMRQTTLTKVESIQAKASPVHLKISERIKPD